VNEPEVRCASAEGAPRQAATPRCGMAASGYAIWWERASGAVPWARVPPWPGSSWEVESWKGGRTRGPTGRRHEEARAGVDLRHPGPCGPGARSGRASGQGQVLTLEAHCQGTRGGCKLLRDAKNGGKGSRRQCFSTKHTELPPVCFWITKRQVVLYNELLTRFTPGRALTVHFVARRKGVGRMQFIYRFWK